MHDVQEDLVTVVVPAYNEEVHLGACLDSVLAQDHAHLQVVVVDSNSSDGTADIVRARMAEDARVELVQHDRRNIPSALNAALHRARGTWLVRVDAHSTVGPTYVSTAVDRLRDHRWSGVGGRKDGVGSTCAGCAIAVAMGSRLGVGNSVYHWGTTPQEVDHLAFGAYSVDVLRQVGGWDERLTANEDFELDHRLREAGHHLLFDPALVIDWQCRQSVPDLFRQYRRYGRGKVDVAVLHPDSLRPRHLVPPLFVAYSTLAAALGPRHPRWLLAMLGPYAAVVLGESVRSGRALSSARERVWLPPAFVAMHVGWGVGVWSAVPRTVLHRVTSGH
jgi:succinoglycan biosynthesis protein ExoA